MVFVPITVFVVAGKFPVMIGATFISHGRKEEDYFTMASYLLKHCPEQKDLKAYGTDGDHGLINAMKSVFPEAVHLLCDLHTRDNMEVRKVVVRDIFGSRRGSEKEGTYHWSSTRKHLLQNFLIKLFFVHCSRLSGQSLPLI